MKKTLIALLLVILASGCGTEEAEEAKDNFIGTEMASEPADFCTVVVLDRKVNQSKVLIRSSFPIIWDQHQPVVRDVSVELIQPAVQIHAETQRQIGSNYEEVFVLTFAEGPKMNEEQDKDKYLVPVLLEVTLGTPAEEASLADPAACNSIKAYFVPNPND